MKLGRSRVPWSAEAAPYDVQLLKIRYKFIHSYTSPPGGYSSHKCASAPLTACRMRIFTVAWHRQHGTLTYEGLCTSPATAQKRQQDHEAGSSLCTVEEWPFTVGSFCLPAVTLLKEFLDRCMQEGSVYFPNSSRIHVRVLRMEELSNGTPCGMRTDRKNCILKFLF